MQAYRHIETAAGASVVVSLPESLRRRRIEIIILPVDEADEPTDMVRRSPPAWLLGKGRITGDIISPIIPESDWKCLA